jgi:energy-coupling factor transporter ATP-binding protein EcfA2
VVALAEASGPGETLERLAGALEALDLSLDPVLEMERQRLGSILRSYVIPRAENTDNAITVVFAGPTGSGKSTLINSLIGLELSQTGVLRPTTTRALALVAPGRMRDFATIGGVVCDVITGSAPLLETMCLVDTPDIDSTATDHRTMAETLIDNADAVVFVTSVLRYSDEVPWEVLHRALDRGIEVIHVLNRVGASSPGAVVNFQSRLRSAGLDDRVLVVAEHHRGDSSQPVPSVAVRSLRRRLLSLITDGEQDFGEAFELMLGSTLARVTELAHSLREHIDHEVAVDAELSAEMADRASRLPLTGIGEGLYPVPPSARRRLRLRRWKGSSPDSNWQAEMLEMVIERLGSLVRSDLRRWLAVGRRIWQFGGVSPEQMLAASQPTIDSAIEGWIELVRRIAEEHDGQGGRTAQAVLIDAATNDEGFAAASLIYGPDTAIVVERARRDLRARMEVVYQQAASQLLELTGGWRLVDDSDLRAALSALRPALTPANA